MFAHRHFTLDISYLVNLFYRHICLLIVQCMVMCHAYIISQWFYANVTRDLLSLPASAVLVN